MTNTKPQAVDHVVFEARLVGIGDPSSFDLADYADQDLMIFVATPEEIRKAAPLLFRRPARLQLETPATAAAPDLLNEHERSLASLKVVDSALDRMGFALTSEARNEILNMRYAIGAVIAKGRGGK